MEDLAILDYSTSTVHFYKVDFNTDINYDYIKKLGLNPNNCFWMFAENLEIIKHKGICK